MLENLFNLIKEHGSDDVINNPVIPNEQNSAVLASATHSVAEEFQGVLAGGGLQNIMSLFGGGGNNAGGGISSLLNNPIVGSIISNFTNKLTNQHGIAPNQASGIAGSLIPNVISSLINRTNDSNDSSFNINGIIGSLTGNSSNAGGGFDLQGLIGKFAGGSIDANGDGHVGLDDIISKVTSGAKQQQSKAAGGGGLMDMIKGFMG
jgi:uncharacterized membrane protein YeaQ/YmgE (transglycosylase-associated protein family)